MGLLSLTQKDLPQEDLEKYLLMLRKSAFNMHELMEDLLLWAGSQLDKISFDPCILNVKEVIEAANSRLTEMARNKGITVLLQVDDDTLTILADREMIRTIIRNLLSNAIKFTRPNGRVEIQAKAIDGQVEISVSDNGLGIKKDDLEKIFSKTSTFTTYGTSGERGTGLGLDICKDFVEKHKGNIWVESEFGKGSKFVFTLREF
jgi:signal transduction histidine kinase